MDVCTGNTVYYICITKTKMSKYLFPSHCNTGFVLLIIKCAMAIMNTTLNYVFKGSHILKFHRRHLILFWTRPLCRCPPLLAVWICLWCLFRKWHSHKTFPFLIILIYWSQWPLGSVSGQLPFMLEKDNKNEIWRPHVALYQHRAARPRQTGHSPVKDGISLRLLRRH